MSERWLQVEIRSDGERGLAVVASTPTRRQFGQPHALRISRDELRALGEQLRKCAARGRQLTDSHAEALLQLYQEIFRRDVGQILDETLEAGEGQPGKLLLRLRAEDPELQRFPWEAIRGPRANSTPLAMHPRVLLVRPAAPHRSITPAEHSGVLRLLLLAPHALDDAIALQRELESRCQGLDISALGGPEATWESLRVQLRRRSPPVIHFVGRADPERGLALGSGEHVSPEAFAESLPAAVRLVYFQSPREAAPGELLPAAIAAAQRTGVAIANRWVLPANHAQALARRFYTSLTARGDAWGDPAASLLDVRNAFPVGARFAPTLYLRGDRTRIFIRPGEIADIPMDALAPVDSVPRSEVAVEDRSGLQDDWIERVAQEWARVQKFRASLLENIESLFGDPHALLRDYVEPDVRPGGAPTTERLPAREALNRFLEKSRPKGHNALFVVGRTGAGATALLVMLKLSHLAELWPREMEFVLKRYGPRTLASIRPLRKPHKTVLLIDGVEADLGDETLESRLIRILDETRHFRQVLFTCTPRALLGPELATVSGDDPGPGELEIGAARCALMHLTPFSEQQLDAYLQQRFPNSWADRLRRPFTRADNERLVRARAFCRVRPILQERRLLLAQLDALIAAGPKSAELYAVYASLVDGWLSLLARAHTGKKAIPKRDWLNASMALAQHMHTEGRTALTSDELEHLQTIRPEFRRLDGLEDLDRSLIMRSAAGTIRFAHDSLREFLVVRWALEQGGGHLSPITPFMRELIWSHVRMRGFAGLKSLQATRRMGDLLKADLEGVDLRRAGLQGIELRGANLRRAALQGADLRESGLQGADLQGADLKRAILWRANLVGADLDGADLDGADLDGAIYDASTQWSPGFSIPQSALRLDPGAQLQDSNLQNASLQEASLQRADLQRANLQGARLQGANLRGADLQRADLTGANLDNATLEGADLQRADLQRATLIGADLLGADLRWAYANEASLSGADMQGANLEGTKLQGANLMGAQLQLADMRGANLRGANLEGANLAEANLNRSVHNDETLWPEGFDPKEAGSRRA